MKYIDAGTTAEKISNEFEIPMSELCDVFADIPSADVQPVKHGEWKINSDGYYPYCSECGKEPESGKMTKFCPNCGARMDGDTNE